MSSYTDVYERCGLMTEKTVMAHGIYLTDNELEVFKKTGTAVSHCPNSNFTIISGVLEVRRLLEKGNASNTCNTRGLSTRITGVKVGLGTDVSGGYSYSMLDAFRQAMIASKVVHFHGGGGYTARIGEDSQLADQQTRKSPPLPLSFMEGFYLCTLAGAEVMSLGDKIGNFLVGHRYVCGLKLRVLSLRWGKSSTR